jgi:hypothetical protein
MFDFMLPPSIDKKASKKGASWEERRKCELDKEGSPL